MRSRVTEVRLRNYKSIGSCAVSLGPLTLIVGPNGSGKSNFVDALRFVSDALNQGLEFAIRQRGGVDGVRRRSTGHPTNFGITLKLSLGDASGFYAFEVGAQQNGAFVVQRERASVSGVGLAPTSYEISRGVPVSASPELGPMPKITPDRLLLVSLSGLELLRPLYDALAGMAFYNVNPAVMKEAQPHDPGDELAPDGGNIASVVRQLQSGDVYAFARVEDYLSRINPLIERVDVASLGTLEILQFYQRVAKNKHAWRFLATAMSDGTLRSVGLLTAVFQRDRLGMAPSLIAVEEPEMTIHPGAAGIVFDALREASEDVQIIATTHSPDLLDNPDLDVDSLRVVRNTDGETFIGPADAGSRAALRQQLCTAGELLRQRQLEPDVELRRLTQAKLFSDA